MDDLFSLDELAEPILDVISALVVILDKSGRIVHFNRACQETTGYDFSEVNGIFVWDILLKSDEIQTVQSVFSALSAGSFPNQFTNYWVTKAGKHRLISWSNTASLSPEGDVRYVIATGIDITAQKEAEDALREREAKLRAILDTAVDAIITISEEGLIEDLNPAAERMFEYAASELVGQNVKILTPPSYRDKHDEYIRRYRETGEKRIIGIDREGAGRRKDGTDFPVV